LKGTLGSTAGQASSGTRARKKVHGDQVAKTFFNFNKALLNAKTEEEVKHAYAEHFSLHYDTEFRHDL